MNIRIRPETPADFPAISRVHWDAFGGSYAECVLVGLHRIRSGYDPRLSLVAEIKGNVVGHVLFSPRTMMIRGEPIPMVNLAPVGVLHRWQGRSVGSRLIRAGLESAIRSGYHGSFLLGHPAYYSRFGFKPRMYSQSSVRIQHASAVPDERYTSRPFREGDIAELMDLWEKQERKGWFSPVPDADLSGWVSVHPDAHSMVLCKNDLITGYIRLIAQEDPHILQMVALDRISAQQVLVHAGVPSGSVRLPLDPGNDGTARILHAYEAVVNITDSCMVNSFGCSLLDDYLQGVDCGNHAPGRMVWPAEFDGMG